MANRTPHLEYSTRDQYWRVQLVENPFRQLARLVRSRDLLEQYREFVATRPSRGVANPAAIVGGVEQP
jgi:hypothetical protein